MINAKNLHIVLSFKCIVGWLVVQVGCHNLVASGRCSIAKALFLRAVLGLPVVRGLKVSIFYF